jgi:hypothetical protein
LHSLRGWEVHGEDNNGRYSSMSWSSHGHVLPMVLLPLLLLLYVHR